MPQNSLEKKHFFIPLKDFILFTSKKPATPPKNNWYNLKGFRLAKTKSKPQLKAYWNIQICAQFPLDKYVDKLVTISGNMIHRANFKGISEWLIYINNPSDIKIQSLDNIELEETLPSINLDSLDQDSDLPKKETKPCSKKNPYKNLL